MDIEAMYLMSHAIANPHQQWHILSSHRYFINLEQGGTCIQHSTDKESVN